MNAFMIFSKRHRALVHQRHPNQDNRCRQHWTFDVIIPNVLYFVTELCRRYWANGGTLLEEKRSRSITIWLFKYRIYCIPVMYIGRPLLGEGSTLQSAPWVEMVRQRTQEIYQQHVHDAEEAWSWRWHHRCLLPYYLFLERFLVTDSPLKMSRVQQLQTTATDISGSSSDKPRAMSLSAALSQVKWNCVECLFQNIVPVWPSRSSGEAAGLLRYCPAVAHKSNSFCDIN